MTASSSLVIDQTTVTSLLAALSLLIISYVTSLRLLPANTTTSTRVLFIWHSFDSLIHFLFEGSFLYNCFNVFLARSDVLQYRVRTGQLPVEVYPAGVHFLGFKDRYYGSAYGNSPTAKLWQEYAKADISLELLTVFIGGPLAAYICYLLAKGHGSVGAAGKTKASGKLSFWMIVLATGELYGGKIEHPNSDGRITEDFLGFMTFAPEWLSGSPNLDTSNFMYL
jgi:hypothetical protein